MADDGKPPPEEDGTALWRHIAGQVRPLKGRQNPPATARPDAARKTAATPAPMPARPARRAKVPPPATPAPPELTPGAAPGVDRRTADRLRRGQLGIEAEVDLHGLTQVDAHRALTAFIAGQQAAGRRCVRVITGKGALREGGGVLRAAVPRWLNEPDMRGRVLAISHAQPRDGGEGALYVLLKRKR